MVRSGLSICTCAVAVVSHPLVPRTVTVYVPAAVTDGFLIEAANPLGPVHPTTTPLVSTPRTTLAFEQVIDPPITSTKGASVSLITSVEAEAVHSEPVVTVTV